MVCEKCEKKGKLGKVITPDPWKAGASNITDTGRIFVKMKISRRLEPVISQIQVEYLLK